LYSWQNTEALLLNLRHTCHVETSNDISCTALPVASYFWHSTEVDLWTFQLSVLWWISNLFKPIHTLINIACCSHKRVYVHYNSFQRGTRSLFHVCYFSVIIFKPHWFEWPFFTNPFFTGVYVAYRIDSKLHVWTKMTAKLFLWTYEWTQRFFRHTLIIPFLECLTIIFICEVHHKMFNSLASQGLESS